MSRDLIAEIAGIIGVILQPFFLTYFLLYNGYMLTLVALSARQVRRRVAGHFVEDLDLIDESDYTKPLTMVIPAFNEEVTIVDSITNLIHCDYPRFEVVVVNDGSQDQTMEVLKRAFRLRRTDLPYRDAIGTARVRAIYQATVPLPKNVSQLVVIDKENAGKADALERRDQCLDRALLRQPRCRLDSRPAGAQGADADGPGRPAHRRRRRPGCHREWLHHPAQQSGERGPALPSLGPVPDGGVPALLHHRPDRIGPARLDPDSLRRLRRLREGDGDPGGRVSHAAGAPPAG